MRLKKRITGGILDCFTIWKRELQQIYKDIGVFIFFIIVPVVYPIFYGTIYNTETIREVPLIVVDDSHSSLAREFIRKIDSSPDVHVFASVASLEEACESIDRKDAYGILLIPSDFSRKIHRGEQAVVAIYPDMSSMLFYKAILMAATEASFEINPNIHIQAEQPVLHKEIALYNTQNGFASFLLPAILILVIQQTLLLGISMLGATTREKNQGRLIPPEPVYAGTFRIVFGKALAYQSIYVFVCIWALIIVPNIFNIPQLTHYKTLLLFALPYLLACIFFAMIIASFIRGRETPLLVLVFTSLIFLFISGISWPLQSMPAIWKYTGYLIPSSFGIQGFVKINSMGAALWDVSFEYRMLWLQTGIYFLITCLIYRWEGKRTKS